MAEDDGQEKKHAPGDKKWREAAEKGQIPRSADLSSAAVLVAGIGTLVMGAEATAAVMVRAKRRFFSLETGHEALSIEATVSLSHQAISAMGWAMGPPMLAIVVAVIAVNLAQTRGQMGTDVIKIDWNRVNPVSGFQNQYLSWTPLVELGKGLLKLGLLAAAASFALWTDIQALPKLSSMSPVVLPMVFVDLAWRLLIFALPGILIVAAGDYAYSWYKLNKQLMRTDQQLRDDQKQSEGDPHMKAHRRARQRQITMGSMLAAMADADVVVSNPTHYAVALRYKRDVDAAPIVVAKGVDHMALRLLTEARKQGVVRIEDRPLARKLYARVKVGQAVPEDLFNPVAKVLAVVFRRRAKKKVTRS